LRNQEVSSEELSMHLDFPRLAQILESLVKKSWGPKSQLAKQYHELSRRMEEMTVAERQNIRDQVMACSISAIGGQIVLDPAISIPRTSSAAVDTYQKKNRTVHSTGKVETDSLRWLREQKGPIVVRELKHRHAFNRDLHFGGLLSSSEFSSVHLQEAWPAELQSKATDIRPNLPEEQKPEDCQLICVKIARNTEGHERLRREGDALQALQGTGRVAELWNACDLARYLDRGMLITIYQPVPPPQDSGHDNLLSLDELEDRIEEVSKAVAALHSSGWIWNGLKPNHILYLHSRMDPRDHVPPLRLIGLENSRRLFDRFEYEFDPIWSAPEQTAKQRSGISHQKSKGQVAAVRNFCLQSGSSPAADLYSLGLLVNAHLARSPQPVIASNQELCSRFNAPIHDRANHIGLEHWLFGLASDLVQTDPLLRPTAEEVLQRISSGRRQHSQHQILEPSVVQIDGYIHPDTLQMVWPVALDTTVIADQRNKSRMTDYVTVKAAVETPPGKVVADYAGRPVTKEYLRWLRHLKLHSHALNDGARGAYDGRRKCNGIYDMAYYTKFRQVQSQLIRILQRTTIRLLFFES
jgi:hypothetical protein